MISLLKKIQLAATGIEENIGIDFKNYRQFIEKHIVHSIAKHIF